MNLINKFAAAIKQHEGFFIGSRSWRNNNPGNLKFVGQEKAIGRDDKGFARFATLDDGQAALINQINFAISGKSKVYFPEMSILQYFEKYAPSADNNNPKRYAEFVANFIGKDINFKIKDLANDIELKDSHTIRLFFDNDIVFEKNF